MTRYIHTQITTPSSSISRKRPDAVIPPFAFLGKLKAGGSGLYQPPKDIMITGGSIVSAGDGNDTTPITVLRQSPFTEPVIIGGAHLAPTEKKILFTIEAPVTAYDHIFVVAWIASAHTGVVVQLVGVEL